ncbi:MAG: PQQ-like beta-propeller repeat protein [Planctomycetes bacterium]|nr:PQQ-like beta-propeller repeat protein [Planctomycetota bacterium]
MKSMTHRLLFAAATAVFSLSITTQIFAADSTVGWRHDGSGIYANSTPVTTWSDTENIAWKTKIGGTSYSSIVSSAGKLFCMSDEHSLHCLDAASGKLLWTQEVSKKTIPADQQGNVANGHLESGNTPHTPAIDGDTVYVCMADSIVAAYDFSGKQKWAIALNQAGHGDGRSSSPILSDGVLIWQCGHAFGIDCKTGKIKWENKDSGESYGTPIEMTLGGKAAVVTANGYVIRSSDGTTLASDLGDLQFSSPISSGTTVYWIGDAMYCYELPDTSEKFEASDKWVDSLDGELYGSAIIHENIIYAVSNDAVFYAVDANEGAIIYEKPLQLVPNVGAGKEVWYYPSLVMSNGNIHVWNNIGECCIVKPGKEFKEVAINRLSEGGSDTPLYIGNKIYARNGESIICIGAKE